MRCKACNKQYASSDWSFNGETDEFDDLCFTCRTAARINARGMEYEWRLRDEAEASTTCKEQVSGRSSPRAWTSDKRKP